MNVFDLRDRLVSDYQSYTRSFIKIRDVRIPRAYPLEYPLGVPLTQSPAGGKPFDRYARIKNDAFSGHVVRRELP